MTLKDMVDGAHKNAKAKGFWDNQTHNIPEKLCLIHSEVSEALEEIRRPEGTPAGLASELADICIRVADLCGYLNLNLDKAVTEKMLKNAQRPRKHNKLF